MAMTARERFQAIMQFQPFDRLPLVEWAVWWDKTIERWHTEGLPAALTDRYDICRHFGHDMYMQDWFPPRKSGCPEAPSYGAGIIKDMADYDKVRQFLYPSHAVNTESWRSWAAMQGRGEAVLWFTIEGFFWFARELLGIERHMYAFYEQPDVIHRINEDLSAWMCEVIEELTAVCVPDFMTFAEDMSYNNGPMLSKELFDEFMKPYYDKVVPKLKERGVIPVVDSDGDITTALPWLEEAGLEGILPLERQSGVDVAVLRERHPRMRFVGHFDKMVMNKGEEAMRGEFERLLPVASKGGFIISCDHQTPPGVSLEDYLLYMQLFREYSRKAGMAA